MVGLKIKNYMYKSIDQQVGSYSTGASEILVYWHYQLGLSNISYAVKQVEQYLLQMPVIHRFF